MNPLPGILAVVRNRSGIITKVEPSANSTEGMLHLVTVEYTDTEGSREETLIWEREPSARLIEGSRLPDVAGSLQMVPVQYDAMIRATRWGALYPYVDPDTATGPLDRLPFVSPLHGAIETEDYQMVPLLKAMRMPRVTLLLADDVGLGKTVETGLIISELILQRRIRKILILTPASLREQWLKEMYEKFNLNFDIIDRDFTRTLRRDVGLDSNPWRSSQHIIASYHFLKQPDILEEFLTASHSVEGSPQLPWDLLIVDEVHNLAPGPFGRDSELTKMLRTISPLFEHRLFATATPHNGRTRSFSGLLEILDPARFSQTSEFTSAEKSRVQEIVIRRMKSEINKVTNPPRFSDRDLKGIPIELDTSETHLSAQFDAFKTVLYKVISEQDKNEQTAGRFAVEVLGKRLLSCPVSFADSWYRMLSGISADGAANWSDVKSSEVSLKEDSDDDREQESRLAHAVHIVGAWLRPFADKVEGPIHLVTDALRSMGLSNGNRFPVADSRYDALKDTIQSILRNEKNEWIPTERIIIFTEYKTTLDYLVSRLRSEYPGDGNILELYGTGEMDQRDKDAVKAAFNDPASGVKILVATDASSEGLNLQKTSRYLFHFDIPWNPSRLEQRNGRIDRYAQARDVTVFHFNPSNNADLAFLSYVAGKVHQIREDIGSVGEVLDSAVQQRLVHNRNDQDVRQSLELGLKNVKGRASIPRDATSRSTDITGKQLGVQIQSLREEIDLDPSTLKQTLELALGYQAGLPRLSQDTRQGFYRFIPPIPPMWRDLIEETLRMQVTGKHALGALPALGFDSKACIKNDFGRPIFSPDPDVALLHLWHPLIVQTLRFYARQRFPGSQTSATRWLATIDPEIDKSSDAIILLTVEELAFNELRETIHHWVHTLTFPVKKNKLGHSLAHMTALKLRRNDGIQKSEDLESRARELWYDIERDIANVLSSYSQSLTETIKKKIAEDLDQSRRYEIERFQKRQAELSQLITEMRIEKLERDIREDENEEKQGVLFDADHYATQLRISKEAKEEEVRRLKEHIEEVRAQLIRERDRVLNLLLPKRHALRGDAQVLPVGVEIRFREVKK
jgi:superfamily II DNA or RNA helicase